MTDGGGRQPLRVVPRRERSAAELITATPDNRMVGYPYTKYMVSVMDVDMAAAVIVASHAAADELGVPGRPAGVPPGLVLRHRPGVRGRARPDLCASPAMAAAGAGCPRRRRRRHRRRRPPRPLQLLRQLGEPGAATPSASTRRPRGVTVTGGLPFSGGAGSDYMMHSIATMADVLRADPGAVGHGQRRRACT